LLGQMKKGEWKRILVVATGALLSPISYQQKESIPCIAHAVAIEADT
jgi:stage V sporulation protein AD